jgi:DNA-binding transcriptional LysR family regulator
MRDLNDFHFFAAVVNHGGFSAAARALKLPKSRLSKRVARLEERLGVRLLERSTRRLAVTDVGREFHRQCEAVLAGAEEAEAIAARARSEPHGTLRVNCPPGFAGTIMAGILPGFMRAYPAVRIELSVVNRRVDLIEERIDVAFRVRTRLDSDPELTIRILGKDRIVLVASPDFAAAHGERLTPKGLGGLPTVTFGEAGEVWRLSTEAGGSLEVRHRPILACVDFDVLIEAAAAGLGVSLIPVHACAHAIHAGRLVQVMPEWTASDGIIHLAFTSRRGMLPATRAFIDYMAREFPAALAKCRAAGAT